MAPRLHAVSALSQTALLPFLSRRATKPFKSTSTSFSSRHVSVSVSVSTSAQARRGFSSSSSSSREDDFATTEDLCFEAPLRIVEYPDPVLRAKNKRINTFDERLKELVHQMFDVMYKDRS